MIRHFKHIVDGIRVPAGETYTFVEGGNGELGFYVVADGTGRPYKAYVPVAVVRAPVDGRPADPQPSHRGHRPDLRHDQHDRRGVRQVSTTGTPTGSPPAPSGGMPATPPAPPAAAPAADTVTLTIDGQTVTVPKGTNVLEAARTLGIDITRVLLPPGPPDRRAVPAVPGRRREEPEAAAELPAGLRRGHGRPHDRQAVDARAQAAARVHAAQPPDRLPDLRQGRRVHAAEAVLRARQRRTRASTCRRSTRTRSSTSVRRSSSIRSAASCARAASARAMWSRASTSSSSRTAAITRS